jgi:hypothetical protein
MSANQSSFNSGHVKVLLRKDFLTLKRNWMFFLTFLILPVAIMSGFSFLESIVEGELAPERHNLFRKSNCHFTLRRLKILKKGGNGRVYVV